GRLRSHNCGRAPCRARTLDDALSQSKSPWRVLNRESPGATRPAPGGIVRRVAGGIPAGACGRLGVSCGLPEPSRRDADEALEVLGELALVREAGCVVNE